MKLIDVKGLKVIKARRLPTPTIRMDGEGNPIPVVPVIVKRGDFFPFDARKEVFDFVNGDHTEGEVPNGLDFQRNIEATVYLEDYKAKVLDPESDEVVEETKQRVVCVDVLKNPKYSRLLKGADKDLFPDFVEIHVHAHGSFEVLRQPVNTQADAVRRAIADIRKMSSIKKGDRILGGKGKIVKVDEEVIQIDLNEKKKGEKIY